MPAIPRLGTVSLDGLSMRSHRIRRFQFLMKNKRISLDDILSKGSKSFQRLNTGTGDPLSRRGHRKAAAPGPVAAGAPDARPQRIGASESLATALANARSAEGGPERPHVQ